MQSQPLIPHLISIHGNQKIHSLAAIAGGVLLLSALAQIAIPLPWTPVPITGQTFGVALIAFLWGRRRGTSAVALYLAIGFLGAPIFAQGRSGFLLSPTSGYLFGMLAASYLMGTLSDLGWTHSFWKTWFAALAGSCLIFLFGVVGLSYFLPLETLFSAGVLPFLPGDFIKTLLVCFFVRQSHRIR